MYQGYICQWGLSVCVCVWVCVSASVKTKRQFSEYFIPVYCLFPVLHHNADHWNMQGCIHRQTNTNKDTHTCSVSRRSCRLRGSRLQRFRAGATTVQTHLPSGSEAVLYTCQPSSEPGYKPCTQTGSALIKSLQEYHPSSVLSTEEKLSRVKLRVNYGIWLLVFCFCQELIFWGYQCCF